jgi:hypothetical protein
MSFSRKCWIMYMLSLSLHVHHILCTLFDLSFLIFLKAPEVLSRAFQQVKVSLTQQMVHNILA